MIVAFVERGAIQVPIEDLTGHFSALVQVDEVLEEEGDELPWLATCVIVRQSPTRSARLAGAGSPSSNCRSMSG
jgi:hypothetical protein